MQTALEMRTVAPRRGAWIETMDEALWMLTVMGRTPQGCVD